MQRIGGLTTMRYIALLLAFYTNKNLWILMRQRLWGLGVAMTSAGPCASHSRQMTTPTPNHQIFTGRVLFRTPNQQCQSTEGIKFG